MSVRNSQSRREFLKLTAFGAASAAVLAACAPAAPAPTAAPAAPKAADPTKAPEAAKPAEAPKATEAPKAAEAPKPTEAPKAAPAAAGKVKEVARNRTLILMWSGIEGKYKDAELWNPFAIGANHQNGPGLFFEPLYYFSAFADKYHPWLAEKHVYTADQKSVTITLRKGINWSDGKPFGADDLVFTLESLMKQGGKVKWGTDVASQVAAVKKLDDQNVQIDFKMPAPRFVHFMSYKFDIGVYIVPKHVFSASEDWAAFQNYDMAKEYPITTGPWKLVFASPDQKVIDRRDKWWAVDAGLVKEMPKVERIVYLPVAGETQMAQAYITNQIDASLDLRPTTIKQVIAQNPKIITHTGREEPFGYTDWWPTALYLNNTKKPFDNPDVRWAVSHYIDRDQVVAVGYKGAGSKSQLPMPKYKSLQPYFDAVKDLLAKYDTNKYDPKIGDELMTKAGCKKVDGVWATADGQKIKLPVGGWTVFADIGPIVSEQLKKAGFDATFAMPPDQGDQLSQMKYTAALNGHAGSVEDPYFTMRLYKSEKVNEKGVVNTNQTGWGNAEFDKLVDELGTTAMTDKVKMADLFKKAMEIWLPQLPDLQITEWYHRIAMNTAYWTNWPTKDNAYVNGAFWHLTFQLILNELKPAQ